MLFFLVTVVLASANIAYSNPLEPHPRFASGRIIGGQNAEIETFPYQVAIEYKGIHNCGGSIISAHYILTAGHCVDSDLPHKYMLVRAGSTISLKGGSLHQLEKVVVHEKYHIKENDVPVYDVAVVRVKEPFHFDETRQPISLYKKTDQLTPGQMAMISGWGYTVDEDEPSNLQAAAVPIIDSKTCREAYFEFNGGLDAGQICAGYYGVGGTDSCTGDSGGPLAIDGRLAGIVSWGYRCAEPNFPGIYADVAYFRDWIDQHVQF